MKNLIKILILIFILNIGIIYAFNSSLNETKLYNKSDFNETNKLSRSFEINKTISEKEINFQKSYIYEIS